MQQLGKRRHLSESRLRSGLHRIAPLAGLLALAALAGACKRDAPAEPVPPAASDASSLPVANAPNDQVQPPSMRSRPARDDAGHLIPRSSPPPLGSADVLPTPGREPDWDLDPDAPARDYVDRYVRATHRYGDKTGCVRAAAARTDGERTLVDTIEVKDDGCNGSGAVRDTFVVRPGDDRLALADPKRGAPLAKWPDGSAPDGPPSGKVMGEDDLHRWNAPVSDALKKMTFTPIRVQYYGRGSYPVITLAGWRDPLRPGASADAMRDTVKTICAATSGAPVGFFGALNRADILRVRCPDKGRWERL